MRSMILLTLFFLGMASFASAKFGAILASVGLALDGASLSHTSIQSLQSTGDMDCNRNIMLEIQNHLQDRNLHFDGEHMYSGVNRISCQPTVVSATKEVCGYSKRHHTAAGVCGVTRYTVRGLEKTLNIDIIFDHGYSTQSRFGIHIEDADVVTGAPSSKIVWNMYNSRQLRENLRYRWFQAGNGVVKVEHDGLEVIATMGQGDRVIMKVEVWGKGSR